MPAGGSTKQGRSEVSLRRPRPPSVMSTAVSRQRKSKQSARSFPPALVARRATGRIRAATPAPRGWHRQHHGATVLTWELLQQECKWLHLGFHRSAGAAHVFVPTPHSHSTPLPLPCCFSPSGSPVQVYPSPPPKPFLLAFI